MARENPTWGRRRIQAELPFLGYEVAELTVASTCGAFAAALLDVAHLPEAHIGEIVAIDFFVVPTLAFQLLFGFLSFDRPPRARPYRLHRPPHRRLGRPPTGRELPGRDRAEVPAPRPGCHLRRVFTGYNLGMREILIAPRAPWQNPFAERVIGSIRRECLDHVIVINEAISDVCCAGTLRTTTPPARISPFTTTVPIDARYILQLGRVAIPQVGGLHHLYQRAA